MSKPILLWNPPKFTTSDDAGTTVVKSALAPPPPRGPYELFPAKPLRGHVPPLAYFCIRSLRDCPDQVHRLEGIRIRYELPVDAQSSDVLRALIPGYRPLAPLEEGDCDFDWSRFNWTRTDPRLWAVIVQVFDNLPEPFYYYTTALSDKYLPLLQQIPSTTHFSLVTVLSLVRHPDLTDDTITQLKGLHTLCALDASHTELTAHGIGRLASTMSWTDDASRERRGPWGLRILRLEGCKYVEEDVLPQLARFPLLSVIDLRGTCVSRRAAKSTRAFQPCPYPSLHGPTPACESLDWLSTIFALSAMSPTKHSATSPSSTFLSSPSRPFVLVVNTLHHGGYRPLYRKQPAVNKDNTFVVFSTPKFPVANAKESQTSRSIFPWTSDQRASGSNGMRVGNTDDIQRMDTVKRRPFYAPTPRSPSPACSDHRAGDSDVSRGSPRDYLDGDFDSDIGDFDDRLVLNDSGLQALLQQSFSAPLEDPAAVPVQSTAAFCASARPRDKGPPKQTTISLPPPAPPAAGEYLPPTCPHGGDPFVLYRHPPPWSRLDELSQEHIRGMAGARHGGQHRVPVQPEIRANVGSTHALDGVRGIIAAIGKRRKPNAEARDTRASVVTSNVGQAMSKNPFRKAPLPEVPLVGGSVSTAQLAARMLPDTILDPGLTADRAVHTGKRPRLSAGTPLTCSQVVSSFQRPVKGVTVPAPKLKAISNRMPILDNAISSPCRTVATPVTPAPFVSSTSTVKLMAIGGRTPIHNDTLTTLASNTRPAPRATASAKSPGSEQYARHAHLDASSRTPSPEPAAGKSILVQPMRNNKPLIPISRLPVPQLPESVVLKQRQAATARAKTEQTTRNRPNKLRQTHLRLGTDSLGHSAAKANTRPFSGEYPKSGKRSSDVGIAVQGNSSASARRKSMPFSWKDWDGNP